MSVAAMNVRSESINILPDFETTRSLDMNPRFGRIHKHHSLHSPHGIADIYNNKEAGDTIGK